MKGIFQRTEVLVLLGVLLSFNCFAGGDEVIVIYNTRVPESKEVADYYALKRNVPTNQLLGFSLPTGLDMSREEFRDKLQKPLAHELETRGLWQMRTQNIPATDDRPARFARRVAKSKIRYAVLCYGVPVRVLNDNSIKDNMSSTNAAVDLLRNEACIENELVLLPLADLNLPLNGPINNPFYSATNELVFHPTNGLLLVTRLDGPSAAIARGLVDKAIEAENDGMWGRAYFDLRGISDPKMKLGDDWMMGAAEICRRLGFETAVDSTYTTFPASFPMSQIAFYCGWYDLDYSGPFTLPKVEFMPGAFAYHLHSFNAADIRNPTNRWVGPLLAKGATITMGSVNEPYLPGTPNVAVFAGDLIYSRFNFAEAAYASQLWLSWQTTIIGDPLYRPFGKLPDRLHAELVLKQSKFVEWSYLRLANLNQMILNKPIGEVANFIEQIPVLDESAVLTEKLADVYTAQGKPSSAIFTYQRALERNPSSQQRIRLRLTLGEKLQAADREADAIEDYHKLLEEAPDYPGKDLIEQKLAALEPKPASTNAPPK